MEEECHLLDLELARLSSPESTDRESFGQYSTLVSKLHSLEEKRHELKQFVDLLQQILTNLAIQIPNAETRPDVQSLKEEAIAASQQLEDVVGFSMSSRGTACFIHT